MNRNQRLIFFSVILLCCQSIFAQGKSTKKDSTEIYKGIQNYSKRNNFTKFLHKILFVSTEKNEIKKVIESNYGAFDGKIIRKINIITLDPFGFSELDSARKPRNWAEKSGNFLHNKTKGFAIRNLLLIKKNKPLDTLLVRESERLIRSQRYISRVHISLQLTAAKSDSVDVFIRVLDSWSTIPKGSVSPTRASFAINELNFFGSGQELDVSHIQSFNSTKSAYGLTYTVPNIKNSFIKSMIDYQSDLDNNYGKSINIERPFYSPFAKWAGGIYFDQQFRRDTILDVNHDYVKQNFKYNSQDYWFAHSFAVYKGKSEFDRTTNLIISARFLNKTYIESPTEFYDPIDFFSNEKLYLTGIGITTRKFIRDKYIFYNGLVEDVPIGRIVGVTGGYRFKNDSVQLYLGSRFSYGKYYKWGFLSANLEVGSYFKDSNNSQTTISFQANYFTNLISVGNWKLRQFVKPQLILGINRLNSYGDELTINEKNGIRGFNSAIRGNNKMVLTFQTQGYAPWNIWGFHLNPFFKYDVGFISQSSSNLLNTKAYSKVGFGLIINNDYLIFKSFQISLAYFPTIPGSSQNVFKTNSFNTSDFGFQDFELAKPRIAVYK